MAIVLWFNGVSYIGFPKPLITIISNFLLSVLVKLTCNFVILSFMIFVFKANIKNIYPLLLKSLESYSKSGVANPNWFVGRKLQN
jgi:hypothetical protein